jgi:hypothetical protein
MEPTRNHSARVPEFLRWLASPTDYKGRVPLEGCGWAGGKGHRVFCAKEQPRIRLEDSRMTSVSIFASILKTGPTCWIAILWLPNKPLGCMLVPLRMPIEEKSMSRWAVAWEPGGAWPSASQAQEGATGPCGTHGVTPRSFALRASGKEIRASWAALLLIFQRISG